MNVREAHKTRHLVIRLDRGEELPDVLVRALGEAEARSCWITGVGAVEAAEIALYDQHERAYTKTRRLDRPAEVVSLSGNGAVLDGVATVRLSATLARETDVGLEVIGGQLVWARVFSLELCVTVFDDVTLTRIADERTGLPVLAARAAATSALAEARHDGAASGPKPQAPAEPSPRAEPVREHHAPPAPPRAEPVREHHHAPIPLPAAPPRAEPAPTPPPAPPPAPALDTPALPMRPMRPKDDIEVYPEVGDAVTHFHFGECTVITSDGDRIRLRQDRDGRVREVALTMLRIDLPTVAADGTRHFKLGRKN